MPKPTLVPTWGTETGSEVLGSLVPTSATFVETKIVSGVTYGLIDYAFSGTPDLSSVAFGQRLTVSGFTLNANNGDNFFIESANAAEYKIRIRTTTRTSNSLDESGVTGSASVSTEGTHKQIPSILKRAMGWIPGEKIGAGWLNWWMNNVGQWIEHFAAGGAIVLRAGLDAWRAVTRTTDGVELVQGLGWFRFDPEAENMPGEGFFALDDGDGLGIVEAAHPDAMAAMLAAFVPEILPPVQAVLDFASTAQSAINTATATVPGAKPGDCVLLGAPAAIEAGFLWCGFVSDDNEVTVRISKITTGTVDPAAATWSITVIRPNSMPVITTRGLKLYTNLLDGVYDGTSLEADLSIPANEAAFNLLVNSRQHRAVLADGGSIQAVLEASATADEIMTATGGY